jgi:hypothetical protein
LHVEQDPVSTSFYSEGSSLALRLIRWCIPIDYFGLVLQEIKSGSCRADQSWRAGQSPLGFRTFRRSQQHATMAIQRQMKLISRATPGEKKESTAASLIVREDLL